MSIVYAPRDKVIAAVETDEHVTIIRSRLHRILRELRELPVLTQGELAAAYEALLLQLDGKTSPTAEPTGRAITLTELRNRLTGMPGARPVLDAIDSALADGAD